MSKKYRRLEMITPESEARFHDFDDSWASENKHCNKELTSRDVEKLKLLEEGRRYSYSQSSADSAGSKEKFQFTKLPEDLQREVISYLPIQEVIGLNRVNKKHFQAVCSDDLFLRKLFRKPGHQLAFIIAFSGSGQSTLFAKRIAVALRFLREREAQFSEEKEAMPNEILLNRLSIELIQEDELAPKMLKEQLAGLIQTSPYYESQCRQKTRIVCYTTLGAIFYGLGSMLKGACCVVTLGGIITFSILLGQGMDYNSAAAIGYGSAAGLAAIIGGICGGLESYENAVQVNEQHMAEATVRLVANTHSVMFWAKTTRHAQDQVAASKETARLGQLVSVIGSGESEFVVKV